MDESGWYALSGRLTRERDECRAEIVSLHAGQERIRDEAFQLGRQASWDQAQETIEGLKAELASVRLTLDQVAVEGAADRAEFDAAIRKIRAADNMTCVWHIADAALACRPQGEKS